MGTENKEEVKVINGHDGYSIDFKWSEDGKSLGVKREDINKFEYSKSLVGPKGDKGEKGDIGVCWRPTVDGEGNISWTSSTSLSAPKTMSVRGPQGMKGDTGATGAKGAKGDKGDIGICWRPSIDDKGCVSWTSSTVTTAPATVCIRGPQGVQGPKGDTGLQGTQGPKGATGAQGIKGDTGARGATGATGPAGKDGTRIIVSSIQPTSISTGSIWVQVI